MDSRGSPVNRSRTWTFSTYAADPSSLQAVEDDPRYLFVQGDICDEELVERLCAAHQIDAIVHFAAETHVDRSILEPTTFLYTNVAGTVALLEVLRRHPHIHFHHVSTDEVYGSLEAGYFFRNFSLPPQLSVRGIQSGCRPFCEGLCAYVWTFHHTVPLQQQLWPLPKWGEIYFRG